MIEENLHKISMELPSDVTLVAVSKFHPAEDILKAYGCGHRVFGENRPQEFASKASVLPKDIAWHFIGTLQKNKVKLVMPYASMIESIDSEGLLDAIEKWCLGNGYDKRIDVLLELHLGAEGTKHGFSEEEIEGVLSDTSRWPHARFCGLMGMATNTDDERVVRDDFARIQALMGRLKKEFPEMGEFRELSIGMSGDWKIALEYGATIIRIGTAIFGPRSY
ncbi:MAG: YggS family pyridoxal phosphate-dependent enzyme [Bacteroidales bacterium]|nr:YggS family pyridoxal phosphate-dependent enzyme [Bacteroidales bacterium]MBQ5943704.1 YggS family pyridoxal phosphate-dependent enzyme [Bacteroidales bacterium]